MSTIRCSDQVVEILVAEDSPTQAQKLKFCLEQQGYRVVIAANGALALQAAYEIRPTLIISDVVMPVMDGYELCRKVKTDTELNEIPVILVTTLSDPQDVIRGLECRADNFILKPYDDRYLLSRVQFVLVNREMRQTDQPGMGLEILFNGERHFITADRLQILNLLLSTYEAAIQRNSELTFAQDKLQRTNSELQRLTAELEERVLQRTLQLENTNQALRESERRLSAQVERLNLLHQITNAISERQDLKSIFQVVIRHLEDHLGLDFTCIALYDQVANNLTISSVGIQSEAMALELVLNEQAVVDVDPGGFSRCVGGELIVDSDIAASESPFQQQLAGGGLRSLVAAPLQVENQTFGVLILARRTADSFNSNEVEFLRQLSEHVSLAVHQARLHESLQRAYNDLRQTQEAVMQQERLRALGQMASGLAHDINNAISPAALYTETLLEQETNLTERGRRSLETVQRAIEDVAATVARMREFYREREPQLALKPVQLNTLVLQVMDLTRARCVDIPQRHGVVINVTSELDPDLPTITGIESEIRQSLINLIINAADAMPDGGTLTIKSFVCSTEGSSERRVALHVTDSGIGMDDDTQRRCLEPFFTSKGERGTGLGLPMVYGMAERHNAEIEIKSAPGEGTIIGLSFPLSQDAGDETIPTVMGNVVLPPLRLLIVDDDPLVLHSLRDALTADGHVVTIANQGQDGIDTFRSVTENGESFDAVITDLGMPYVDGRQVASAVKTLSRNTPVILFTGWGQRLIATDEIPLHVDWILAKPPKLRELRETLAKACHLEQNVEV